MTFPSFICLPKISVLVFLCTPLHSSSASQQTLFLFSLSPVQESYCSSTFFFGDSNHKKCTFVDTAFHFNQVLFLLASKGLNIVLFQAFLSFYLLPFALTSYVKTFPFLLFLVKFHAFIFLVLP